MLYLYVLVLTVGSQNTPVFDGSKVFMRPLQFVLMVSRCRLLLVISYASGATDRLLVMSRCGA